MRCCESTSEERRAGNLHAAFCGSRRWVTASGDPVGWIVRSAPYPTFDFYWATAFLRRGLKACQLVVFSVISKLV